MNSALLEAFADVDASPEFRDAVLAYFGERRSSTPLPLAAKLDGLWRADAAKARRLATNVLSLVD